MSPARFSRRTAARTLDAQARPWRGSWHKLSAAVGGVVDALRPETPMTASRPAAVSEPLEPRRLLVTLLPGETFTYTTFDFEELPEDPDDFTSAVIEVESDDPDTEVELFGATASGELSELSGVISNSPFEGRNGPVRGGLGGTIGVQPLVDDNPNDEDNFFENELGGDQLLALTDLVNPALPGTPPGPDLPAGAPVQQARSDDFIVLEGLAANNDGRTFGIQAVDVPVGEDDERQLQLYELNVDLGDSTRDVSNAGASLAVRTNVGDGLIVANVIDDVIAAFAAGNNPIAGDDIAAQRGNLNSIVGLGFSPDDDDTLYLGVNATLIRNASFPVTPEDPVETEVFSVVALNLNLGDPAHLRFGTTRRD